MNLHDQGSSWYVHAPGINVIMQILLILNSAILTPIALLLEPLVSNRCVVWAFSLNSGRVYIHAVQLLLLR
jgi:hypothetical protein